MENWQRLIIIRCTSLVALGICAALGIGHLRPEASLCGFDSDCDEVLSSRFSRVAGVPLPVYGLLTFAAIFGCSLSSRPRAGRVLRYLAGAAGLGGLTLIILQVFILHRLCPFCLVVDVCALLLAYVSLGLRNDDSPGAPARRQPLWLCAAASALALGAALGASGSWFHKDEAPRVPPEVAMHWVPGQVTLVELVDFQCPHCRAMHSILSSFLRDEGKDLHYVRIAAPMPKHPQARSAARAFLCAQAQGKGEVMAEELFDADDLTSAACERLAASLGVSITAYQTCIAARETEKALDANVTWVRQAAPDGLPCIWVQEQRLAGVQSREALRRAVALAEQRLRASSR